MENYTKHGAFFSQSQLPSNWKWQCDVASPWSAFSSPLRRALSFTVSQASCNLPVNTKDSMSRASFLLIILVRTRVLSPTGGLLMVPASFWQFSSNLAYWSCEEFWYLFGELLILDILSRGVGNVNTSVKRKGPTEVRASRHRCSPCMTCVPPSGYVLTSRAMAVNDRILEPQWPYKSLMQPPRADKNAW